MSNILTDLRAALEANGGVKYIGDCDRCMGDPYGDDCDTCHAEQIRHYAYTSLLTDDTIRALLDVAEAAKEQNERYCAGITDDNIDEEVRIALAPLLVEDAMRPDAS